jgi:hypothetical protein
VLMAPLVMWLLLIRPVRRKATPLPRAVLTPAGNSRL